MLVIANFDWGFGQELKKLTRENYALLREQVVTLRIDQWEVDKPEPPMWYRSGEPIVLTQSDMALIASLGLKFEVVKIKNTYEHKHNDGNVIYNLNFALPNIGLLSIDEVTWRDDVCTQAIQSLLEEGWRIIAVCPPNGARRPDYILGRTKPS